MRQQHKGTIFHLRAITTRSALVFALLKAHLFAAQAWLIALAHDLTPLKRLTCNQCIDDEFLQTNPAKYFVVTR
jgi:hypothetical protein